MPKCRKCDERLDRDHDYCEFCGARQKSSGGKQRNIEGQGKIEKKLKKHISYLEGELEDAGIEFDVFEDDDE